MDRIFLLLGALFGFFGVAAGAFGGHALKTRLTPDMLAIFEVGARYHLYHALALLAVGLAQSRFSHPWVAWSGWSFAAGTLLFSGSLYILSLTGVKAWGMVTPVGGLLLLAGWIFLSFGLLKS